jgi:hypothetical protein
MKIKPKVNRKLGDEVAGVLVRQIKLAAERHGSLNAFNAKERRALCYVTEKLIESLHINAAIAADIAGLPREIVLTAVLDSIAGWSVEIDKMVPEKPEHGKS